MAGLLTESADAISANPRFLDDFKALTSGELSPVKAEPLDEKAIVRLLETSAIMSFSEREAHQKLAYKIVIYLLSKYSGDYGSIPFVGQLVLSRLGDIPVIKQMIEHDKVPDYFSYFDGHQETEADSKRDGQSLVLRFPEVIEKKTFNQVTIAGNRLDLTDFQYGILDQLRNGTNLALSAPTSSGKSYILFNYIAERLTSSPEFCAIYIVPTKALVSEVQTAISEIVRRIPDYANFFAFTGVSTLNSDEIKSVQKKVLVLTQERLQEMLANRLLDFGVNLLIVDEAQQVANEGRGIVIEDAVGELVKAKEGMQMVFVSPYVSNLDRYAAIFGLGGAKLQTVMTGKSPVGQNYILVTFKRLKGDMSIPFATALVREIEQDGKAATFSLAYDLKVENLSDSQYVLKAWVARNMTTLGESTLIYCNKPSDCRRVADELVAESDRKPDPSLRLRETIDFLRSNVHSAYYLADYLPNGIGYHYGTMPQFVRSQVKKLFEEQELQFLACTSTLLEGVNLPAKNIVLYSPRKGSIPMDSLSVRNLMGRAGRLNKDYYGKIYCVNLDDWVSGKEALTDTPELIESSTETTLSKDIDVLIEYLSHPDPGANERIKGMATSLLMKQLLLPDQRFLEDFKTRHPSIDENKLGIVGSKLAEVVGQITLDHGIILKNRSIDPRFQEDLYNWMKKTRRPPLPPYPGWGLYEKLEPVFEAVARRLLRDDSKSYRHYAVIASQWIGHYQYKRILLKAIEYKFRIEPESKKTPKKTVNDVIEELDDDIENRVRFDYVRGLKCYCEILAKVASEEKEPWDYCQRLPAFLETGASDDSVLFLIAAGLSRTTAVEIYESFGGEGMLPKSKSIAETISWLKQNRNRLKLNMHPYFFGELELLLG